ncbi:MAG: hypothetical protein AB7O38_12965 [Pirellulaceae bacterium]
MQRSAFQLARRVTAPRSFWAFPAGLLLALLGSLLVVDLGLVVQLLVTRDSGRLPTDWMLQKVVAAAGGEWPFLGSYGVCLLVLIGAGWLTGGAEILLLMAVRRGAHRRALQLASGLRREIYEQTFRLGPTDLLGAARSRPDELFADKVESIRRGFALWWMTIPASLMLLAALLLVAALVNVWLTLLAVLLTLGVWRFHGAIRRREKSRMAQWRNDVVHWESVLREALHLAPLLKGYALVEPPGDAFDKALRANSRAEMELVRGETLLKPLLLLAVLLAAGFLLLIIGFAPNVSVAGAVVLSVSLLAAYWPFVRLTRLPAVLREMNAAAHEVHFFLDREPGVIQLSDARPLDRITRQIVLERVHLADRHGRQLLAEVTLPLPAGQRLAVLATDSQSPLALAGLLVRFYDPTAGRVLFDDHDIGRATLETIRGQTALVLKDGLLFPGTVSQNITCGDSGFTAVQINDALKLAGAEELVRQLPQGLSTLVGADHPPLRADQAFLIGLARALLREPSLLIVQEPEEPAEETLSRELDRALQEASAGRTFIILPARISTLRTADQIYMFHEGRLEGQGKHAELLQASELYRHLCYVRFNHFRSKLTAS